MEQKPEDKQEGGVDTANESLDSSSTSPEQHLDAIEQYLTSSNKHKRTRCIELLLDKGEC